MPGHPVPLENRILACDQYLFRRSGGSLVLVDQAVQDRFSADPAGAEVRRGALESVRISVGMRWAMP
jgi:hypothetical protein